MNKIIYVKKLDKINFIHENKRVKVKMSFSGKD